MGCSTLGLPKLDDVDLKNLVVWLHILCHLGLILDRGTGDVARQTDQYVLRVNMNPVDMDGIEPSTK